MAGKQFPPVRKIRLNAPELKFESGIVTMQHKIYADCIDMEENAIFDAVVRCAKENGYTEAFLLDKDFVLSAIVDAAKKWRDGNG